MVGRNWYVLEPSILEHRFGPIEKETVEVLPKEPVNTKEYEWIAPVYTAQPSRELPIFAEKAEPVEQSVVTQTPVAQTDTLSDMQSAWQEWFQSQQKEEKRLPDASEMMLPKGETEEVKYSPDLAPRGKEIDVYSEDTLENDPHVPPPSYQREENVVFTDTERVNIIKHREASRIDQFSQASPDRAVGTRDMLPERPSKPFTGSNRRVQAKQGRSRSFLLQVGIFAITGLFVAVTALSVTTADQSEKGERNQLYNFINGVSTVEK